MAQELFITCVPGLEQVLIEELQALGMEISRGSYGGVFIQYRDFSQIYELNLSLRTASRVLLPIAHFKCRDKEELYSESLQINWLHFFHKLPSFAIDAHVSHRAFNNSLFAAQVVKDAICDTVRRRTGSRPDIDTKNPVIRLNLFIQKDSATIYFDTSGKPLHERGYRTEGGVAPLRENLAAALLRMAAFRGDEVFVDPCAGSGTLVVEAVLAASGTPPQFLRQRFGFMQHPDFNQKIWDDLRQALLSKQKPLSKGQFIAIEKNPQAFATLQKTLSRAHLNGKVMAMHADFRNVKLPALPSFVITNPPYGRRLEDNAGLEPLYKALGDFMKRQTAKPARGFILSGDMYLSKNVGLATSKRHIVNNGGIDCRLLEFDLY